MMKQVKFKMPRRALVLTGGLLLAASSWAQSGAIKGQVKDAAGEPVMGATITANGKAVGVTDLDGNYSINVAPGTEITITYIGMTPQKVAAANGAVITLQDDSKTLNDVVVIGYGVAKKNDLTGSVTAIKPDEMNHGLQTNATDMIQGKIAGVNVISNDGTPGGGATIRVRGGSSLNASNDPLIVIDGLAMDSYGVKGLSNPLSMVNPNDIESFTVLKDASATAIYGSRASNGVIIITTKKGRKGQRTPKVSYSGNLTIATKRKTLDVLDGPEFTSFVEKLYGKDSEAYKALGWTDDKGVQHFANTDWQDEIYRTAVSHDHNITVTGGVANMPYRVSLGYTNNQGIVKTSDFSRYTASFNLSPSFLNDHLTFNINGKGMIAKNHYADGGAIGAAAYMDPTKPVTADNTIYNKYFGGYTQWYMASEVGDPSWPWGYNRNSTSNPVALLNQKNDRAISRSLVGNIEANYKVHGFEDLQLHVNAGMDLSNGRQWTDYDRTSRDHNYFGYTGWSSQKSYNLQLSMYAQYSHDWLGKGTKDAPDHHFDIMGGYEYQHYHTSSDYANYGTYLNDIVNASGETIHKAGEKYGEISSNTTVTNYKSENFIVSFFGRMNYTLLNRYMLTFTLRDDGSSRFHKDGRWGLFPSLALAWRINDEPFLRDVKAINDFKLRLGWGKTGQQEGIGDYTWIPTYTPNQAYTYYPLGNKGVTYRPDVYNPNLTWEKTTTWNAGLDLSLLNNRLTFNLDYYYRKTTDLINTVYVAAGGNFKNTKTDNVGSLHNEGIEFATTIRPIVTKDFTWEMNYNVAYNKNKIDELTSGTGDSYYVETGSTVGTGGKVMAHAVGHSRSAFRVYQQVYDADGNPVFNTFVDRNNDGVISDADKYYYYKPDPDVTMGMAHKFIYKNWDLGFTMRASLGNYVYNNILSGSMNTGKGSIYSLGYLSNRLTDALNLGFSDTGNEAFSDMFVQNASFLKMDNITLGYSFNNLFKCGNYSGIGGRVYATVQNVFTITNYKGIDPEVQSGFDSNMYPRPFQVIFGVNLNF